MLRAPPSRIANFFYPYGETLEGEDGRMEMDGKGRFLEFRTRILLKDFFHEFIFKTCNLYTDIYFLARLSDKS